MIAAALTMVLALAAPALTIERCVTAGDPPEDCRFVPLQIGEADERELTELFTSARARQEREEAEAKRDGEVMGGVPGFVTYAHRVTFEGKVAWLHGADDGGMAWLDGEDANIAFDEPEARRLGKIIRRLQHPPATSEPPPCDH
jgi:hypothetical protein